MTINKKLLSQRQKAINEIIENTDLQMDKIVKESEVFKSSLKQIDLSLSEDDFSNAIETCLVSYMLKMKKIEAEAS
jgi:hypothetical protein